MIGTQIMALSFHQFKNKLFQVIPSLLEQEYTIRLADNDHLVITSDESEAAVSLDLMDVYNQLSESALRMVSEDEQHFLDLAKYILDYGINALLSAESETEEEPSGVVQNCYPVAISRTELEAIDAEEPDEAQKLYVSDLSLGPYPIVFALFEEDVYKEPEDFSPDELFRTKDEAANAEKDEKEEDECLFLGEFARPVAWMTNFTAKKAKIKELTEEALNAIGDCTYISLLGDFIAHEHDDADELPLENFFLMNDIETFGVVLSTDNHILHGITGILLDSVQERMRKLFDGIADTLYLLPSDFTLIAIPTDAIGHDYWQSFLNKDCENYPDILVYDVASGQITGSKSVRDFL